MKKMIRTTLMTAVLSAGLLTSVYAANVRIDGLLVNFSNQVVNQNGSVMVDAQEIFEELSFRTNVVGDVLVVQGRDFHVTMAEGSQEAIVNDEKVELNESMIRENDRLIVPIRVLSDIVGAELKWDENTGTVLIETGKQMLSVLNLESDIDHETIVWDYERALEQALQESTSLKDLIGSIEVMEDQRDQLRKSYDDLRNSRSPFSSTVSSVVSSLREVETMIDNIDVTKGQIADAANVTLKNLVIALNGYKLDEALLENSIALQEIGLEHILLRHSVGMESEYNLNMAQSNLEQARLNLATLQKSIESQRLSINNFLGLTADTKLYIEYSNTELSPINLHLESYILRKLLSDPTIRQKQTTLDNAKHLRDQYDRFSRYTVNPVTGEIVAKDNSYIKMDNDIRSAERALEDGKSNIENAIRQSHNQLLQIENRHESLVLDLLQAKESYNTVLINYMTGMVTNYDVEQAKLGILNAEIAIIKNIDNHQMAMLIFENPYMGV